PREMYDRPANVFVAGFIGSPAMNIGTFDVKDGGVKVGSASVPLERSIASAIPDSDGGKVTLGFRPESLDVVPAGTAGSFEVEVNLVEELGSDAFVYGSLKGDAADVDLSAGDTNQVIVRIDPRGVPDKGDVISVAIQAGHSHVFSATSGERLG
ncbi:sugar ABC transporter ATP-binding protein, partial [Promicromonospora sp. NPDC052451]